MERLNEKLYKHIRWGLNQKPGYWMRVTEEGKRAEGFMQHAVFSVYISLSSIRWTVRKPRCHPVALSLACSTPLWPVCYPSVLLMILSWEVLKFWSRPVYQFALLWIDFGSLSKKPLPNPRSQRSSTFSSREFTVLSVCLGAIWINFGKWCQVWANFYSMLIASCPAPFFEEIVPFAFIILFKISCLCNMIIYFWTPFCSMDSLMPKPYCLDYSSFIMKFKIR